MDSDSSGKQVLGCISILDIIVSLIPGQHLAHNNSKTVTVSMYQGRVPGIALSTLFSV